MIHFKTRTVLVRMAGVCIFLTGLYYLMKIGVETGATSITEEHELVDAFRLQKTQTFRNLPGLERAGLPPKMEDVFWAQKDPATQTIPRDAAANALRYTRQLVSQQSQNTSLFDWVEAGPDSLGGRALVVAIDKTDPSTILAGTASGGVWKSTDRGATWHITTTPNEQFSVTTLAQDPRPGQTQTWYMAGGEFRGSAGSLQNISAGNYALGLYTSTDNGNSWTLIEDATAGSPTAFDTAFDYVSKLIVSPATGTLFLANNASGIYRSTDGGATFPRVLGSISAHSYNDVAVGAEGTLVAVLSTLALNGGQSAAGGVYLSRDDGLTWSNITPATFPASHQRSKVAIAPSNSNVAYVLTNVGRKSPGAFPEDIRFHKLNLNDGTSEDRTANLPAYPGLISEGAQLHTLNNYTMVLSVKPDDENFVVAGGIVPYRSTDGFATSIPSYAQASIGGYECAVSTCFDFVYATHYPNHWNDQHAVSFNPENPNEMWSANDGGIYLTEDVTASKVVWQNKNKGLNVAQFFGVAIPETAGDPRIIGGLQDHGVQYLKSSSSTPTSLSDFTAGTRSAFSDGGVVYFGKKHALIGLANGRLHRLRYKNTAGDIENFFDYARIFQALPPDLRPPGATGFKFYVHPSILDPVDDQTVFYPDGSTSTSGATLWRNADINTGVSSEVIQRWQRLDNFALPSGYLYTAFGISQEPAHVLYLGASASFSVQAPPRIFRAPQANTSTAAPQDVSIPGLPPGAFVHDIAVNPLDANEILVVFSNFGIIGLYHSNDGGQSYSAVEGNLAGPNGEGPSLRAASILPLHNPGGGRQVYLVATSTGLFSTRELRGMDTMWEQEAIDLIGGVVVDDVVSRASDGRVAAGSHGRGLVVGVPSAEAVSNEPEPLPVKMTLGENYPNPFNGTTTLPYTLSAPGFVSIEVYDITGKMVRRLVENEHKLPGKYSIAFDARSLASGSYVVRMVFQDNQEGSHYTATRSITIIS